MKEQFIEEYLSYGASLKKNLVFGNAGGFALKMDVIWCPEKKRDPAPVIVWIHGGAWSDHELDRNYRPETELLKLASKGYFVACIDYRLSDEVPFPAQIQDCKCAIRFLRAHSEEWGLDPQRIGVWGESAGGHLVNLLGSTEGIEEFEGSGGWQEFSSAVNAVCAWYSPASMTHMAHEENSVAAALLGNPPKEKLMEKLEWASPINYFHRDMPPFLIMHGDEDPLVPVDQSRIIYQKLQELGSPVEFHLIHGQGHGFFQGDEPYRIVRDFFDKWLLVR